MIISYHVVVVLVWRNAVMKQFIRALHDVYAWHYGLIVAPTHLATKRRGRGYVLHRSTHAVALMMVDAMHRPPYTVCDSKSTMDYRWSYGNTTELIFLKSFKQTNAYGCSMWEHDALCLYEPCRPCIGASKLPNMLPPADEPVITYTLNPPIPYGVHEPSHRYHTAPSASIEERTIIVQTPLTRLAWGL